MKFRYLYIPVLVATAIVYLLMLFWSLPGIAEHAGGLMPFDLRPTGYSVADAKAFLGALGPEGRALYLGPQAWLDLLFPALVALTFILSFKGLRAGAIGYVGSLAALAGSGFDYAENAAVRGLLLNPPTDDAIHWASRMTQLKSTGITIASLVLIAVLAMWFKRRFSRANAD